MSRALKIAPVLALLVGCVLMGARCVRLSANVQELELGMKELSRAMAATNAALRAMASVPEAVTPTECEDSPDAGSSAGDGGGAAVKLPPQMAVDGVDYEGDNKLVVRLAERPDMEVARRFVSVGPMAEGNMSVEYKARYDYDLHRYVPSLIVCGEFAFRTNVTLRIAKGFPLFGKGASPDAGGSLKADFEYVFRRRDKAPYVAFADDGRYLPPGGRRAIEIESMNVSNVWASVRRVEPRNVVQLLAREERAYSRYYDRDGEETEELAGEPATNVFRCVNRPNGKELTRLTVDARDGKAANGIYFVAILNGDHPRKDYVYCWDQGKVENPMRFRLVCLSDLGLSVRRSGTDELGVWVTSLMSGKPVAGARVDVYSSANLKVMEGLSDANGWCRPKRVDKGAPFAVVVVAPDGKDMSFMALRPSMEVDETHQDGARDGYLKPDEVCAFLWTDRGIYRHDEKIFVQAILRNGRRTAPKPMPLEFELRSPNGNAIARATALTDADGSLRCETFVVPAEQPSGVWTVAAKVPGKDGRQLGEREIKIEEFAPPQIRVAVAADETAHPSNFAFTVSAEHLFGGPANGLKCEGAVVFEDAPFAPQGWKGWSFGNEGLGLKPNFRKVGEGLLDAKGEFRFEAPLWGDSGLPKAAVRATGQGVVFEDGGRPATMRQSVIGHYYPYYIGSTLSSSMRRVAGQRPRLVLACVAPDGRRLASPKRLTLRVESVESVFSYRQRDDGWNTWDSEHVRVTVADGIAVTTLTNADTVIELPLDRCGDYAVTVEDPETHVSYGRTFYLSDWGDDTVRAPLSDPTAVALATDRAFYREGETPRLTVRSPFAGYALLTVLREQEAYTEVIDLTNATSEVTLRPVTVADAPNLDVCVSVVQSVADNAKHLAVRAHGQATVAVRPRENEIDVALEAEVRDLKAVAVEIAAPGATYATVTVVDEAINLMTGEKTPDPIGFFAELRTAEHPLYDLYHRILPVLGEEGLKANGVKTGGGFGAEMLGRVSPVPTRRFRPLARWSGPVALTNGRGAVSIPLPEFVGEVRVTAVAYNAQATGAASVRRKVTPKLVVQPDAPRFVAPGDGFEVSLPIRNRSGAEAQFGFEIKCGGKAVAGMAEAKLPADGMTNVVTRVTAPNAPGELEIGFSVRGAGEVHDQTICLPVRPAVAWRAENGIWRMQGGEEQLAQRAKDAGWKSWRVFDTPVGELAKAMEWLADYPHGCLEQTSSRIFPLIEAGGVLASVGSAKVTNRTAYVAAGVRRVESMVRANDFVMWPDCNYAPWDREVSLYASHFLVEAERSGAKLNAATRRRVIGFLGRWAMETNTAVAAYACHTLALAGEPEKDRMLSLYDRMAQLTLLDRARLARAFAAVHDRPRAETLLRNATSPASVKEAAFAALALLELDPDDARVLPLVEYLNGVRDKTDLRWGTTGENAHALLAMGAYYRRHPPKPGEKYVLWQKLALPDVAEVREETNGLRIARRFLTPEGEPIERNAFRRGEMLVVELSLEAENSRQLSDLVIEDLFAGAFEPIHGDNSAICAGSDKSDAVLEASSWVMRSDARDDRMLVFSKRFHLAKGERAVFRYPVRVVTAGEYVLPGASVEAMYFPSLNAKCAPRRISVEK